MKPFTRQLGARSGVQLNPLQDNTGRFVAGNSDQVFAIAARFERGRIDKAFLVDRSTQRKLLGKTAAISVSLLNEAYVQMYEAFRTGAYQAVVSRIVPAAATNKYLVAKNATVADDVWTAETTPTVGFLLHVKHLGCFNDGVRPEINATQVLAESLGATATTNVPLTGSTPLTIGATTVTNGMRVKLTAQTTTPQNGTYSTAISGGTYTLTLADNTIPVDSKLVTLRFKDVDGVELFAVSGSLDPLAVDEFSKSTYLPNVVTGLTDEFEVVVGSGVSVLTTSTFYGKDVDGLDKYTGELLSYFTESGTTYANSDLDAAITRLKNTEYDYGYLHAGGTQSVALLSRLMTLGYDTNTQIEWDIHGNLTPAQAVTFCAQLGIDSHYSQYYWSPILRDDPVNGGKAFIGTSGINIGFRCGRNAITDANGIAPKNRVVAGKAYPLPITGAIQKYSPSEQELDALAEAHINPVLFQTYNSGSAYVFYDSLTGAKTNGDKKLIAVADMSSSVDDTVTKYAKELLQLPMLEAVDKMSKFLRSYFEGLQTAQWIKVSTDPTSDIFGAAFAYSVAPNANRPSDRMDVGYWLHYDGTLRAVYVQQTISK